MNTKKDRRNSALNSVDHQSSGAGGAVLCECSVQALSARLFERTLTLTEILELSEKCGFWDVENAKKDTFSHPLTFVVPSTQYFASVSRMVE
jgi:hypothetical protein